MITWLKGQKLIPNQEQYHASCVCITVYTVHVKQQREQ